MEVVLVKQLTHKHVLVTSVIYDTRNFAASATYVYSSPLYFTKVDDVPENFF